MVDFIIKFKSVAIRVIDKEAVVMKVIAVEIESMGDYCLTS